MEKRTQHEKNRQTKQEETRQPEVGQAVIRNYKDSVFRLLFREKKELLSLFNAVNGTHYENPDELEVNTLENAIYMSMKNDISCVMDMRMNLYEHQSTVNPNMPLRYLFYVGALFEKQIRHLDLYSRRRILLPTPRFVVLYHGEEEQPERKEMRLSEAFAVDTGEINLELVVLQLNINGTHNLKLKKNCQTLYEYTCYVECVRQNRERLPLHKAVEQAVEECIQKGILEDFLRKNRAEVMRMSIFEYDEELHRRTLKEEGREEGREEGLQEGRNEGQWEKLQKIVYHMLQRDQTPETISELTGEPLEQVYKLQKEYVEMVRETGKYTVGS